MSKRMTKRTRSLLYAVIALAAVGVLLVGLLLLLPPLTEDSDDENPVDESVVLLDKTADGNVTLSSAVISLSDASHTISRTEDDLYTLKGYEDLPLDQAVFETVAESLLNITATRLVVENPQTPADFGLGKADSGITVSVSYSDDTTFSFEIGDLAPSEEGYYFREAGKTAIYLMDTTFCQVLAYQPVQYLVRMPIVAPTAENSTDTVVIRDVTLSGTVRSEPIFFQIAEKPENEEENMVLSGYAIQKPHFHAVDSNSPLITYTNFTLLSALDVVALRPTASDLSAYGLSNPYSVCTLNLSLQRTTETEIADGEVQSEISYHSTFKYTIKLGKTDKDGNYYGVVYQQNTMIPLVYRFEPSAVADWVDAQYEDIADNMLYFQYITNLDSVTIVDDGDTKTFTLKHFPGEEDSDNALTVTANGKTYSTPDFRTLYESLLSLYRAGQTNENPIGTPILTLEFTPMKQHGNPTRIRIYEYTAGHCIAVHNSGEKHLIAARDVQNVQNLYHKFIAGEPLPE